MADDDTAVLESEEAASQDIEDQDEPEAVEAEGEDAEIEEIEFDFGGDKLAVPKGSVPDELADRIQHFTKDAWRKHTERSEAVASKAKELEARETALSSIQNLTSEALQAYSKGVHWKAEVERLSAIDLAALWQSDPDEARVKSDQLAHARQELTNAISTTHQAETAAQQAQQSETNRRVEEGRRAVEKAVKGFDEKAIVDYAVSLGYPRETAERWPLDPVAAVAFHKAMKFDEMQRKAARKKPPPEPAPVRPVARGGSRNTSSEPRDTDSTEEWMRKRNAQVNARRNPQLGRTATR